MDYRLHSTEGPILYGADSWQKAKELAESDGYKILKVEQSGIDGEWETVWEYD